MANNTIQSYTQAVSIDQTNDLMLIYQNGTGVYKSINQKTLLNISGSAVGTSDTQVLTNKTIGNTNTITSKDSLFTLQNASDTTKQAAFSLSGITTGNTRTYSLPDATDTLVGLTATQTLTNKTLTAPTINGGTISNTTITADTINGYTSSTNGSIYGITVTGGTIAAAAIAANAILSGKLGLSNGFTGGVASQANSGTAGGTIYYINLGGIKFMWCITAFNASSVGGTVWTVIPPTSFFSTIQYTGISVVSQGTFGNQSAAGNADPTTTLIDFKAISPSGAATQKSSVLAIGT